MRREVAKNERKKERKKKKKTDGKNPLSRLSLRSCWPTVSLSPPPPFIFSFGIRAPAPLSSLRRPATMSKTIALFDVDGTLTVPRKVRTGKDTERGRLSIDRSLSIDRWAQRRRCLVLLSLYSFSHPLGSLNRHSTNRRPTQRRSTSSRSCARYEEMTMGRGDKEPARARVSTGRHKESDQCSTFFLSRFLLPSFSLSTHHSTSRSASSGALTS